MIAHKRLFILSLAIIFTTLASDQFVKWWMLEVIDIDSRPMMVITDYFNLVMVWNHGVSFGMFAEHRQPLILIVVALLIVGIMLRWLMKTTCRISAIGIGLVVGGALGNIIDRARFGAVADFLDFHVMGFHWPAFNIADATIFIGVVVLCIQSMLEPSKKLSKDAI